MHYKHEVHEDEEAIFRNEAHELDDEVLTKRKKLFLKYMIIRLRSCALDYDVNK